ncbi:hypothetical protein BOX15_Mlig023429g1 [Macrostomum lignano]|uniref:Cytidine deaminase n=1 Tax=Macrostomum lignano TaxID=282301 RepID=A0A267EXU6_9PLAT|nr:hypothetical protein BOX15_Mlig023780g1 [Macrostomum lignano]PAA86344.1 hypothetical protein BOX15_Mlig023429g1 [Macrostomum lignano]
MQQQGNAISESQLEALVAACVKAAEFSYSPYSGYRVGAALLTDSPEPVIIPGCNVENCTYPDGCCAEKTAIVKAVSEGHRRFLALAVTIAIQGDDHPRMCGSCRQVVAEFCGDQFPIYLVRYKDRDCQLVRLGDYLPAAFRPSILAQDRSAAD